IVSTVGEDIEEYRRRLESQQISTSGLEIIKGEKTLAVFIITDQDENQLTIVHPGAFSRMGELNLARYRLKQLGTRIVIINPLIGSASRRIAEQCIQLGIPYVFDPGQNIQTISKPDLLFCAKNAEYLIVNETEFQVFRGNTGLAESQAQLISEYVIVTRGGKGSTIFHGDERKEISIVKPRRLCDPTGAGDAYRAGFFAGMLRGFPLETCAKMGALAGTYCIEETGPQNSRYTYEDFRVRYQKAWKEALPE
ncbi:MAG: PfkB family carbohydrate kinase, partial [Candidatus Ranarchaeia archaeon]